MEQGTSKQPIYTQIINHILCNIDRGEWKPGDRLPTENQLALTFETSRLTAHKAYQKLVEQGTLVSVQGKGTFVKPDEPVAPLEERHKVIGVIFPESTMFFASILKHLERIATSAGYSIHLMYNDTIEREYNAIITLIGRKVDGIILTALRDNNRRNISTYEMLYKSGIPTVMLGKPPFHVFFDHVMCDDYTAVYDMVESMAEKGHRSFLNIVSPVDDQIAFRERQSGFYDAVEKLIPEARVFAIDIFEPEFIDKVLGIIDENDVTVIFLGVEQVFLELYTALISGGYDLKTKIDIICYQTSETYLNSGFPVNHLVVPKEEMSKRCFDILLDKIEAPQEKNHVLSSIFFAKLREK